MDKIWVILTWGTPTCEETEVWRVPQGSSAFRDKLLWIIEQRVRIDVIELLNKDSSDFHPEEHSAIAEKVLEESGEWYRGFVVIHGTDTNAYTLASNSYMIKWLPVPVIDTGSSIPLEQWHSDFPMNFCGALDVVFEDELLWIYHFFWGNLHPGNKVTKLYSNSLKPFVSPRTKMSFGVTDSSGRFHIDQTFRDAINDAHKATSTVLDIDIEIEKNVELIKLTPWTDYNIFDFYRKSWKKGLVIEWYWDWNVPTDSEFQWKIQECIESGMIILLSTQCLYWERLFSYEWGRKLIDIWAIPVKYLTNEAAIAKLSWALRKYEWMPEEIRGAIQRDINGDSVLL